MLGFGNLIDGRHGLGKLKHLSLGYDQLDVDELNNNGFSLGDYGMDLSKLDDGGLGLNKDGEAATTNTCGNVEKRGRGKVGKRQGEQVFSLLTCNAND